MSDQLECPNCEPDSRYGGNYPWVKSKLLMRGNAVVHENGEVGHYDDKYEEGVVYAKCNGCGDVLVDKRDMTVGELL